MALTDKLSAIGVAIRNKTGKTALLTLDQMPTEIASISGGGGGGNEPTAEELTITGTCNYRFANSGWNWVINRYGNQITTKDISNADYMFNNCFDLTEIPFTINIKGAYLVGNMFIGCKGLTKCPKIRGSFTWNTSTSFTNMLTGCENIRDFEELFTPEMLDGFSTIKVTATYSAPYSPNFNLCNSLRTIPSWWYKFKLNEESTAFPSSYSCLYNNMVNKCYVLDEITDIPVWRGAGAQNSNMFNASFNSCHRVKAITFETNADGTPIVAQWKSQTIDLNNDSVGYVGNYGSSYENRIVGQNSGITSDKFVYDDLTYQALKDDPDYTAYCSKNSTYAEHYSRYNHDSAVETINSLPDTSAYLATAGGTNTIKFKGNAGSATDGGAINTLTEEEIAVATAKGWTVTLV